MKTSKAAAVVDQGSGCDGGSQHEAKDRFITLVRALKVSTLTQPVRRS